MEIDVTKRRFTVDEYYKMAAIGILAKDCRTELIDGTIMQTTSMSARHAAAVSRVTDLMLRAFHDKALLRPQLPFRLDQYNEPAPDAALFKPMPDDYDSGHPGPADALLVIEISDSSLEYDRDIKLPVYAASGIPEVWIADLATGTLLVYRNPSQKEYALTLQFGIGDTVASLAFPGIELRVDEFLDGA